MECGGSAPLLTNEFLPLKFAIIAIPPGRARLQSCRYGAKKGGFSPRGPTTQTVIPSVATDLLSLQPGTFPVDPRKIKLVSNSTSFPFAEPSRPTSLRNA
jgi:hypothetical protein